MVRVDRRYSVKDIEIEREIEKEFFLFNVFE